jgi:PPIC-type PPIASE domain
LTRVRLTVERAAGVLAAAAVLAGCGGNGVKTARRNDPVVAHVGDATISISALTHWMKVLAPQHVVPDEPGFHVCIAHGRTLAPQSTPGQSKEACRRRYEALVRQALEFLISSQWLVQEADAEGIGVTQRETQEQLSARKRTFLSEREFAASLRAISQTPADVVLEIRSELASGKLRRRHGEATVSPADVAAYYRRHLKRFHIAERRYFYLVEFLKSAAAARRVIGEVKHGASMANLGLREGLHRTSPSIQGIKRPLYEAIFAARPHELIGPVRIRRTYFVVEITKIAPARQQTLAQARDTIERKLIAERKRRALAAFIRSWRTQWAAKTDCSPGYVVQKCRQYTGPKTAEDPLALD